MIYITYQTLVNMFKMTSFNSHTCLISKEQKTFLSISYDTFGEISSLNNFRQ